MKKFHRILVLFALSLAGASPPALAGGYDRWLPVDPLLVGFWQLYGSIPPAVSAPLYETSAGCQLGQNGPVWYLSSPNTFNERLHVNCTIPKGKTLMVPVIVAVCVPDTATDLADNIQLCRELIDPFENLSLTIDGVKRNRLIERHAHSQAFRISFPEDNIFDGGGYDAPAGIYDAVAEGQYGVVQLAPGKHTIRTRAVHSDSEVGFFDVTYHIDVVGPSLLPE